MCPKRGIVVKLAPAFPPPASAHIQTRLYTLRLSDAFRLFCSAREIRSAIRERFFSDDVGSYSATRESTKSRPRRQTQGGEIHSMTNSRNTGLQRLGAALSRRGTRVCQGRRNSPHWPIVTLLTLGMQQGCCWRSHHMRSFALVTKVNCYLVVRY